MGNRNDIYNRNRNDVYSRNDVYNRNKRRPSNNLGCLGVVAAILGMVIGEFLHRDSEVKSRENAEKVAMEENNKES